MRGRESELAEGKEEANLNSEEVLCCGVIREIADRKCEEAGGSGTV